LEWKCEELTIHSYKKYKQASSLKVIYSLPVQRSILSLLLLLEHVVENISVVMENISV
jgi:hypothetical protein